MQAPDERLEGLVIKLGQQVSPKYPTTFLGESGYALQQKLIHQYGYDSLRWALTYCLENKIVPSRTVFGLVRHLCVRRSEGGNP